MSALAAGFFAVAQRKLADFNIAKFTAGPLFGMTENLFLVGCIDNKARETARQCWRFDLLNDDYFKDLVSSYVPSLYVSLHVFVRSSFMQTCMCV